MVWEDRAWLGHQRLGVAHLLHGCTSHVCLEEGIDDITH
jgi:hypothetical protein